MSSVAQTAPATSICTTTIALDLMAAGISGRLTWAVWAPVPSTPALLQEILTRTWTIAIPTALKGSPAQVPACRTTPALEISASEMPSAHPGELWMVPGISVK